MRSTRDQQRGIRRAGMQVIVLCALLSLLGSTAHAQHPMDVQKLSADGDHLKALAMYELLPARTMTIDARIAAAKSAWALGLNTQAAETFDVILRDDQLSSDTRARLLLSRGVLEYQEGRYQEAALFGQKNVSYLSGVISPFADGPIFAVGQTLMPFPLYAQTSCYCPRGQCLSDNPEITTRLPP